MYYAQNKEKVSLIGLCLDELRSLSEQIGEEAFRGQQLFDWIYKKNIDDHNLMTNLPGTFITKLSEKYKFHPLVLAHCSESKKEPTKKFLFRTENGHMIESVLMHDGKRSTVCLSTQVGCAVDCQFCATAQMGFLKNLTAGEMIDQFIQIRSLIEEPRINVVFMGMGEPFLNYRSVIQAAELLHRPDGINLGFDRITISTVGIVPKIERYTQEGHRYKLAISLNGVRQEQRSMIMPISKVHTLNDLLAAARKYASKSRRKLTIEYVLIEKLNDSPEDAKTLKRLLRDIRCKLNLIPYNEIGGSYRRPNDDRINAFLAQLQNVCFPVTVRWSKGTDIDAGCGQLAIK
ncbi:MAG: 23S rRNA (adenine(2503)-C(2))-methyltransferase RlmN [Candidatus Marinimicrobia bacterium]|nr:23S rRNA (adenine(2503)-C(2))-methyltransferase RlmN [Candidatus Neomarinimicrobiota bacterium]